ncbi:MAG: DUF309 domain-containing protein [Actinomycetota bacterium]
MARDRDELGRPRNARPRDALGRPLARDASHELPREPDPATPEEALQRGIACFNAGRFFEAHELWEFGWHPAPEPERDFWQGIIQVAVGFTHFQRQNPKGAVTLLERGAKRLSHYGRTHNGLPVAEIASAARAAAEEISRNGMEASPVPPAIPPV